ncbi:MAG: dienelactone hydrolase family protein [Polyangiaceae bacterium]
MHVHEHDPCRSVACTTVAGCAGNRRPRGLRGVAGLGRPTWEYPAPRVCKLRFIPTSRAKSSRSTAPPRRCFPRGTAPRSSSSTRSPGSTPLSSTSVVGSRPRASRPTCPRCSARPVASSAWPTASRPSARCVSRASSRRSRHARRARSSAGCARSRSTPEACGGPGVGAVGMCFTGGFALGMMVDDRMLAPVLSQPSVPFALSKAHRRDLGVDDATLERIKARASAGQCVMGLRFTKDPLVPDERFHRLREELGDKFIAVEIDSSRGNAHGIPRRAHSVLTYDFVDAPGHPTKDALDRVLAFFKERLQA